MRSLQHWMSQYVTLFLLSVCLYSTVWAGDQIDAVQVVVASDGSKVAVWEVNDGSVISIQGSNYDPVDDVWSTPVTISTDGESSFTPKLYINALNNVVVGWWAVDTTCKVYRLKTAMQLAGASWSKPSVLSGICEQVRSFQLQVDQLGKIGMVTAIYSSVNIEDSVDSVWVSTASFGGSWSDAVKIR